MCTCAASKSNFIPLKATELKVDAPMFVQRFCDVLFAEDYRATRCYPSKLSRSPKTPMPEQIVAFFNTYLSKHIGDKMPEKTFMKGYVNMCFNNLPRLYMIFNCRVTRAFTNATYKNTPVGAMKLAVNAHQQKLRRRVVKVTALKKKIAELKGSCPTKATDITKLRRYEFESKQAEEDKANIEEDIASLLEVLQKKKDGQEKENDDEIAALHGVDMNRIANPSEAISDEEIANLGLDPQVLDNQEIQFSEM